MTTATEILPYRPDVIAGAMAASRQFFRRSTSQLTEEQADFAPQEGLLTAKEQVGHVAHTVEWFLNAAEGKGFDMDFPGHMAQIKSIESLAAAFAWLDRAFDRAAAYLAGASAEDLAESLPENPIMGGPKGSVFGGIIEHTAHHRGVLTVYARLQGLTPPMPYMEEGEGQEA